MERTTRLVASTTSTVALLLASAAAPCASLVPLSPFGQEAEAQGAEPGQELKNPIPYTKISIGKGRKHYLRHCQTCHGFDGRALENIDFEAADLTQPSVWRYGTRDGDIFRVTRDGAGDDMPPFSDRLRDQEIWELVNYLRSLGPEEHRPPLVEMPPSEQ